MKDCAKRIADSLMREYAPLAMILYGSYADGTADADSDFDALLICDDAPSAPRSDVLHGVRLMLFRAEKDAQTYGKGRCASVRGLCPGAEGNGSGRAAGVD